MKIRLQGLLSRHSRAFGVLFALYWGAMFLATHIPLPHVEAAPQNTDKFVHLVMYAGFAFLLSLWISTRKPFTRKTLVFVMSVAVAYAALDELLQIPLKSRSGDAWDFLVDLLGAIVGLLMFGAVYRHFPRLWEAGSPE